MANPAFREDANYLRQVREQYENYPYPPRDPQKEKQQFICIRNSALDSLNHYHFSGQRDFSKGLRVLVAGGGTGDAVITLAEQLRNTPSEIFYLDISGASMQVAKERAKVRGLSNITWNHGSLLDAGKLLKGKFDLINCSGVLHHLESPEEGLAALEGVLADDGMMDLMLYAKYGRQSVYQLQDMLKIINRDEPNMQRKVENCKAVLRNLPMTHPFRAIQHTIVDATGLGDPGIYDLFLHSHDVAYSVPEIYTFMATAGLVPTHFLFGFHKGGNDLYRLEAYMKDGSLKEVMQGLSLPEKQAAAELLHGGIIKHEFYAARKAPRVPQPEDHDYVPVYSMTLPTAVYDGIRDSVKQFPLGQDIVYDLLGYSVRFMKTPNTEHLFALLDGQHSIGEILAHAQKATGAAMDELQKEFSSVYRAFNLFDLMLLKAKSVPRAMTIQEISALQKR